MRLGYCYTLSTSSDLIFNKSLCSIKLNVRRAWNAWIRQLTLAEAVERHLTEYGVWVPENTSIELRAHPESLDLRSTLTLTITPPPSPVGNGSTAGLGIPPALVRRCCGGARARASVELKRCGLADLVHDGVGNAYAAPGVACSRRARPTVSCVRSQPNSLVTDCAAMDR